MTWHVVILSENNQQRKGLIQIQEFNCEFKRGKRFNKERGIKENSVSRTCSYACGLHIRRTRGFQMTIIITTPWCHTHQKNTQARWKDKNTLGQSFHRNVISSYLKRIHFWARAFRIQGSQSQDSAGPFRALPIHIKQNESEGESSQVKWHRRARQPQKKDGLFKCSRFSLEQKCGKMSSFVLDKWEVRHVMSGLSWNLVSLETSLIFDYQRGRAETGSSPCFVRLEIRRHVQSDLSLSVPLSRIPHELHRLKLLCPCLLSISQLALKDNSWEHWYANNCDCQMCWTMNMAC